MAYGIKFEEKQNKKNSLSNFIVKQIPRTY